jgi:diaminopimelate decarboxylase
MGDNLEVALYDQPFDPQIIDKAGPSVVCDVVGRHCESGDTFVRDHELVDPQLGDLLTIPVTGAYCYTMSNNYNGNCRPPVIFCHDGETRLAVRRETFDDLLARDLTVG